MSVELVILGSSSMKSPHCSRMRSSAVSGLPATKCASSSNPPAKGEMVVGVVWHSGAGAPYWPHLDWRLVEIELTWEELRVRLARTERNKVSCQASQTCQRGGK